MARAHRKGDVEWRLPNKKQPIAYSTTATNDLIVTLSQEGGTIREVRNRITFDREAQAILDRYIENGYGEIIANTYFR